MTTINTDLLASSIANAEYKKSLWHREPHTFARSERRCLRVIQRDVDQNIGQTLHALEHAIALIVGEEQGYRFGVYKQWEADFLRHLLGFTTAEEERQFNEISQQCFQMCLQVKMGKRFTALLRHNSPLKQHMYDNGSVALSTLFDHAWNDVNPLAQFSKGRGFSSFLNGNNKQRFFVEVHVNNAWYIEKDKLPWQIFIGCTQGHITGVVSPAVAMHQLTMVELDSFGWIFHVTDQKHEASILHNGLRRFGRDSLHFMFDNDGSNGYVRKGAVPGTVC